MIQDHVEFGNQKARKDMYCNLIEFPFSKSLRGEETYSSFGSWKNGGAESKKGMLRRRDSTF